MDVINILFFESGWGTAWGFLVLGLAVVAVGDFFLKARNAVMELEQIRSRIDQIRDATQFGACLSDFESVCNGMTVSRPIWTRFLSQLTRPPQFAASQVVRAAVNPDELFSGRSMVEIMAPSSGLRWVRAMLPATILVGCVFTGAMAFRGENPAEIFGGIASVVTFGMIALATLTLGRELTGRMMDSSGKAVAQVLNRLVRVLLPSEQLSAILTEMQKLNAVVSLTESRVAEIEKQAVRIPVRDRDLVVSSPRPTIGIDLKASATVALIDIQSAVKDAHQTLHAHIEGVYSEMKLGIGRPTRLANSKSLVVPNSIGKPGLTVGGAVEPDHLSAMLAFLDLAEYQIETLADVGRQHAMALDSVPASGHTAAANVIAEIHSTIGRLGVDGKRLEAAWQRYASCMTTLTEKQREDLAPTFAKLSSYREGVAQQMVSLQSLAEQRLSQLSKAAKADV